MSVRQAQELIGPEEFQYWIAYNRIEPIGPERLDFMIAQLTAIFAQAHSTKGKNWSPKDFMPFGPKGKRKKSPQELQNSLMTFAKLHNRAATIAGNTNGS